MRTLFVLGVCVAIVGCSDKPTPTSPSSTSSLSVQHVSVLGGSTTSLAVGGTVQLSAVATLGDGTTQDVTSSAQWSSDNAAVVSVNDGLVRGEGAGSGDVIARYQGATGLVAFQVAAPASTNGSVGAPPSSGASGGQSSDPTNPTNPSNPSNPPPSNPPAPELPGPVPESVTITGGSTVGSGNSLQLHAIAHMSDGTDRDVSSGTTWSTGNTQVATVSGSGTVHGGLPGTTFVTATYDGMTTTSPMVVMPGHV